MFLRYPENHPNNTFKFLNLDTNHLIMRHDITWLNKNYSEWKGLDVNTTITDPKEDNHAEVINDTPFEDSGKRYNHTTTQPIP